MLHSVLVKTATNAWTRQLLSGGLGSESVRRLVNDGLVGPHPDSLDRHALGGHRKPQFHAANVIPLQSPGMGREMRQWQTQKALWDIQNWREKVNGRGIPSGVQLMRNGGLAESSYRANPAELRGNVAIPPKHRFDFPGVHRSTLAHETGHALDYERGPQARGNYNLQDRLLFHKLEKRAPGALLNQGSGSPHLYLSEAWAENAGQKALRPGASEGSRLSKILSHLRNNYLVKAPHASPLGALQTRMHGFPLATQTKLIEPFRDGRLMQSLGGAAKPLESGLARAVKTLARLRR